MDEKGPKASVGCRQLGVGSFLSPPSNEKEGQQQQQQQQTLQASQSKISALNMKAPHGNDA
eukprot:1160925-Pelagomonas_calceolata.AAC.4